MENYLCGKESRPARRSAPGGCGRQPLVAGLIAAGWQFLLALPLAAQLFTSSVDSHEVFCFDPVSGQSSGSGAFIPAGSGGLNRPHGILHRPGDLLVASFGSDEVKRYDRATGAYVDDLIPGGAGLSQPVYLAISPVDGLLYVSSQGNDQILRFDASSGGAADGSAFISGGLLDGPSGFDWSPDGTVLYVAGRYSANVLAYDAATGTPLGAGHEFATGLGAGNTFGLVVDDDTGDVFVASAGDVHRFNSAGSLQASIAIPGLAIGMEPGLDNDCMVVASNDNLYAIAKSNNSVTGPLLSGVAISTLNFFHFSPNAGIEFGPLEPGLEDVGGVDYFAVAFVLEKADIGTTATLQISENLHVWRDAAAYIPNGAGVDRNGAANSVQIDVIDDGATVTVTERDAEPVAATPARFYRLRLK